MIISKKLSNSNSNIWVCFIVGMLLFISIIPFSYAEKTYSVYVDPLPEFGNFAQSSVPDALDWWEQKLPDVKFKIVSNPESADFTIQWVRDFGTEVIGYAFDDLFMEVGLGDSYIGEIWYPYSTNYVTDIVKHEIGHILGYEHVNNPQDIMYAVTANTEYGLIELQFDLLSDEAYFLPVYTTKDTTTINYQVNSENAEYGFDVYVVPSEADLDKWASDAPFNFYQDKKCFAENIFHTSGTCDVEYGSGLLIISNDTEVNKRTYFDVKMTEKSIKNNNVLSSTPPSSIPSSPSNIIPTSSSSYNLYVDESGRFSVEYPSNWYVYYDAEYDFTNFYDHEEWWTSSFSVEGFVLTDMYDSNTDDGKLEEIKEMEKIWCDTQTYAEAGKICYNFEIINSDIKTLDSGHTMFVLAEKYTLQYGPGLPGEFPITSMVTEVHNGNDGWLVYTESEGDAYPAHKEKIMNFIQSFSLSDKSNSMQIPSTTSTTPPQINAIPVSSPQIPTSIPIQSPIIDGAFLNIDPSIISLSYGDELVKIYGNIGRDPNKGERVIVNFNHPDNTIHGEILFITGDGYFETYYTVNKKSVTGTYLIDAMLRENLIGEGTLRLDEYSSQTSTPSSPIPTNLQNSEDDKNLEQIDATNNEPQPQVTSTPKENQEKNNDDFKKYSNSKYNFSFIYPSEFDSHFKGVDSTPVIWKNEPHPELPAFKVWKVVQTVPDGLFATTYEFKVFSDSGMSEYSQSELIDLLGNQMVNTFTDTCSSENCTVTKTDSKISTNSNGAKILDIVVQTVTNENGNTQYITNSTRMTFLNTNNDILMIQHTTSSSDNFTHLFYEPHFTHMIKSLKTQYIPKDSLKNTSTIFTAYGETIVTPENGGGCLIATATYGSEMALEVQQLRELRDNILLNTESGTQFMGMFNDAYYSFSPTIADMEREYPMFKEAVKLAITPMISSLSILNYVDMNSESEVLGYGISLILLNLGMYLGVPAVVIIGIRKR